MANFEKGQPVVTDGQGSAKAKILPFVLFL